MNASTILCDLIKSNGYNLLPQLLFDTNFELKSIQELAKLKNTNQLSSLWKTLNYHLNTKFQWQQTENKKNTRNMQFFIQTYGFVPNSVKDIRIFFLESKNRNLHYYVNSSCEVWTNLDDLLNVIHNETDIGLL